MTFSAARERDEELTKKLRVKEVWQMRSVWPELKSKEKNGRAIADSARCIDCVSA